MRVSLCWYMIKLYESRFLHLVIPVIWSISCGALVLFANPQTAGDDAVERQHVHSAIVQFLQRGQLVIELFPPLSYVLASQERSTCFRVSAIATMLAASGVCFHALSSAKGEKIGLFAICGVIFSFRSSPVYFLTGALEISTSLCEALTIWAIILAGMNCALLPGILILLSLLLGADTAEYACLALLFAISLCCQTFRRLGDIRHSLLGTLCRALVKTLFNSLIYSSILVFTTKQMFPPSETSGGGNFHLRYLSAEARRWIRPAIQPQHMIGMSKRLVHDFHDLFDTPVSIYVVEAGFLWTDFQSWNEAGSEDLDKAVENSLEPLEEPQRVIFTDKLGRMSPWILQEAAKPENLSEDNPYSDMPILIRDADNGGFLTVDASRKSAIDRRYDVDEEEEKSSRLQVSIVPQARNGSFWKLVQSSGIEKGFRLHSVSDDCFLSSSLRTLPNLQPTLLKDPVLYELRIELEASCTFSANPRTSTLHIVDGYSEARASTASLQKNMFHLIRLTLWWTLEISKALWRLNAFRSRFPTHQETPRSLLWRRSRTSTVSNRSDHWDWMIWSALSLHVLILCYNQRWGVARSRRIQNQQSGTAGCDQAKLHLHLKICFLWFHVIYYDLMEASLLMSRRLSFAVAIMAFSDIFAAILR